MAIEQIFTNKTDTGESDPFQMGTVTSGPRGALVYKGLHISGITTATVLVQIAPTSSGPWVTAPDGQITADTIYMTPLSGEWWYKLNQSVATNTTTNAFVGG